MSISNAHSESDCIHETNNSNENKSSPVCIQVESPGSMAFNSNKNLIYVTNTGSDTITIIDSNTNKVIEIIVVDKGPVDIKYVSDTNSIYVANYNSSTISVIDANTNKVSKS